MARKERLYRPGALYHVILRGNDRRDIFGDDKDRFRFYAILNLVSQRRPFKVHAFCLMTNHIHMEIQVADIPLSKIIQSVAQRYTQWFNWRYHKVGHLFQGRYKAIMLDADEYLLELAAYIHLNPVRAHLVKRPEKYRWSSHRAFLGNETLPWLETAFILSHFSSSLNHARSIFSDFVLGHIGQGRVKEFHGEKTPDSRIFGDEFFVSTVLNDSEHDVLPKPKPGLDAVIAAVEKVYDEPADLLLKTISSDRHSCEARALAAWATMQHSGATLTDLARFCGRDIATVCYAAKRAVILAEKDPVVQAKKRRIEEILDALQPPTIPQRPERNSQDK